MKVRTVISYQIEMDSEESGKLQRFISEALGWTSQSGWNVAPEDERKVAEEFYVALRDGDNRHEPPF